MYHFDHIQILIFLLLLIVIILDHFEPDYIKVVSALCAVSILYDIIWLTYNKVRNHCVYERLHGSSQIPTTLCGAPVVNQ